MMISALVLTADDLKLQQFTMFAMQDRFREERLLQGEKGRC